MAFVLTLAIAVGALAGLARPADAATSSSLTSMRSAVVHLTNIQRAAKGCRPLKVAKRLTKSAQAHANDMSKKHYFSHTSANGTSWDRRIEKTGWKNPGGENIAYGFLSATSVLSGWMHSPGHKRNIMDCNFKWIGVGYTAKGHYFVQDFGY